MDASSRAPRWLFVVVLLLILVAAAGLRLYRLPDLPLGLHYDEAANGILAGEIARGVKLPVFIPSYTGKEVLFFYWTALWMKLVGISPLGLRLSAALVGLATVAASIWAIHELLHDHRGARCVALLSAAFLATSFWHLVLSRYGFRAVTQPLLQALTVAALWRGMRYPLPLPPTPPLPPNGGKGKGEGEGLGGLPWLLLAGLFCGLTAYTYLAARAFPIPLAAALLAFLVVDRDRRRARLGQIAIFIAVAALTLAPLACYWLTHPGSFVTRAEQVAASTWAEAWHGVRDCLGMFFIRGDPYIRFNLPFRPLFDPFTATFFLVGIGVVILGLKSRAAGVSWVATRVFLLIYLPVMLLPSALATSEITPSNLRTVGLLPFIYVFPALGLSTIISLVRRFSPVKRLACDVWYLMCAIALIAVLAPVTAFAYFGDWAVSPALYYAADGDMADVAAYLNEADLAVTTPYVANLHYRHPTLAFVARDYSDVRWLAGGRTVVFPEEGEALSIFPRSASDDLTWVESVLPAGSLVAAPLGPDGAPAFHVFRFGACDGLLPTRPLVADLAHTVLVLGYDVLGEPRAGESIDVAVWWQVLNPPVEEDYGPVARLVDSWGFVWGGDAPFHYPSEQWTTGEVIGDLVSISVPPEAPPGDYVVRFSLYSPGADRLLTVLDDAGRYAGTYVEMPMHLERAAAPADPDALGIRNRFDAKLDGLTLLGANLDTPTARPGEPLFLTLYWQASEAPLPDYDITLGLGDVVLHAGAPVHGAYPFSEWTTGEVIADRHAPRLPRDMPAGEYPLQVQVDGQSFGLGTVVVQAADRTFEVPAVGHPLGILLGDQVELLGYDLSGETVAPGETLTLTLYWQALTEMDESYTVFTHLIAPDGSMTGQRDNPPVGGNHPTNLWLAGEVVSDAYEITISADAAPGEHLLEVGMYVAETGARLPVSGTQDDGVVLQTITITE
jgi:hypothetical protein